MAEVVQVQLTSGDTRLTCWVDTEKRFKVGDEITLRKWAEPDRLWWIESVGARSDTSLLHTDWQVGGITEVRR